MKDKAFRIILYSTMIIIGAYFLFEGLYKAKPFLIPLSIAVLLAMVMVPVARKFESWGVSKGWAVLFSDLIILAFCVLIIYVVGIQVKQIADDWPQYEKKLQPKIEQVQQFVSEKTGMGMDEIKEKLKGVKSSGEAKGGGGIGIYVKQFFSFGGNFLLVFVYIFFLMYYRQKFKKSILGFVPKEKRATARKIIDEASKVSQHYLFGRFILIVILAVLYAVGLMIVGIKQAVLISLIAAMLSLIPYIGNIVGYGIALIMGALTSDGIGSIVGVSIVFGVAQFVESYILEPYIVGDKVDLNPTLTIVGVVVLGTVWGVAGMVIAIPVLGIVKVIADHVPVLNPVGYALGNEDISTDARWVEKLKDWVSRKKNHKS